MAAKKTNAASSKDAGFYVVGPRGNSHETVTFRDSRSGQFVTRVMSNGAFTSASGKANSVIREVLKHPPKLPDKK